MPHDKPGMTLGISMPIQFKSCQKPETIPSHVLAVTPAFELINPSGASFEKRTIRSSKLCRNKNPRTNPRHNSAMAQFFHADPAPPVNVFFIYPRTLPSPPPRFHLI